MYPFFIIIFIVYKIYIVKSAFINSQSVFKSKLKEIVYMYIPK